MTRRYGRGPLHLLGHVALFALVGYATAQVFGSIQAGRNWVVWLVGAVVLHDAILWPLYTGADTVGRRLLGPRINYVRVPAALSLLLALVFVSTITGEGSNAYRNASAHTFQGYALRWLLISLALFSVSTLTFLIRRRRALTL